MEMWSASRLLDRLLGRKRCYALMSNARAGSTFVSASLAALGARCSYEYSWRPFTDAGDVNRFLRDIPSLYEAIQRDNRLLQHPSAEPYGTKLTLPIYELIGDDEAKRIRKACRRPLLLIHLVRNYWELLKSNLSRGVAHDYDTTAPGWKRAGVDFAKNPEKVGVDGRDKPCLFVNVSEKAVRDYLNNLVRNDYIFNLTLGARRGVTMRYEATSEDLHRAVKYLELPVEGRQVDALLARPMVRKLPEIPDEVIPYTETTRGIANDCYRVLVDGKANRESAAKIYARQVQLIETTPYSS